MIESHPGLFDEVIEVYQANTEQPANVLLATLNGPARIQQRGFQVTAEHLLAVLVDTWRIDEKSRFLLYDFDEGELATRRLFKDQEQAAEESSDWSNTIVLRLQVP